MSVHAAFLEQSSSGRILAPGTAGRGKDDDGEDGDSPRNLGPVSLKPCPTARAWAPEARNMRWVAP